MEGRKSEQLIRLMKVLEWLVPLRYGASAEQIKEGIGDWSLRTIRRDLSVLVEAGLVERPRPNVWKARREPDLSRFLMKAIGESNEIDGPQNC